MSLRRALPLLAGLALGGCGFGRVALQYDAAPPVREAKGAKIAVVVDASDARAIDHKVYSEAPLKLEPPVEEALKGALELELSRLGLRPASPAEADATLLASVLEVGGWYWSFNVDVAFRLSLKDKAGRLLGQRVIRGTSGAYRGKVKRPGSVAAADAMSQLGRVFEGLGWFAALRGEKEEPRPRVPFPIAVGAPIPAAFILPVEDSAGPHPFKAAGENHFVAGMAPAFDKALGPELRRQGVRVVDSRDEADWLIDASVSRVAAAPPFKIKLRYLVRVYSPSGVKLWEGQVEGRSPSRGTWGWQIVDLAAAEAAAQFSAAMRGVAPVLDDVDPAGLSLGGVASVLGSVVPGVGAVGNVAGVGSLRGAASKAKRAQEALELAQTAKDLHTAVRGPAPESSREASPELSPAEPSAPAAFAELELALLPIEGSEGPALRAFLEQELVRAGYRLKTLKRTDAVLGARKPGESGTTKELGALLQVDALLSVETGPSVTKARLVRAESGELLWEGSGYSSSGVPALAGGFVSELNARRR